MHASAISRFLLAVPLLLAPLCLISTLQGCASQDAEAEPETMSITVDFGEIHRCSRISPEITITSPPEGTQYYDIRLVEYEPVERFLGGGTWKEDGTGIIPEGALTRHYTGPCPPTGKEVNYAYIVAAMQEANPQPLEVRIFRFTPE